MPQPPMIETGYKPEFGLGALYQGMNAGTSENLQNQAVMQGALQNLMKQKEAALAQDEMNSPAYRQSRIGGMIGENQTKKATGEYDTAILGDKIKTGVEKLKAEGQTAQYSQIMTNMEKTRNALESLLPELEGQDSNLGRNINIAQRAVELGLTPQMAQQIANIKGPEDLESLKKLKATLTYVLTQTPKHRQDMEKEELKSTTSLEQSRISAAAHMYGSDTQRDIAKTREGDDERRFKTSERNATLRSLVSQITNLQTELGKSIKQHSEEFGDINERLLGSNKESIARFKSNKESSFEHIKSLKKQLEKLQKQADAINSGSDSVVPTASDLPPGVTVKNK